METYVHIGFTGTREGMTDEQKKTFRDTISRVKNNIVLHNGCCVGADENAFEICLDLGNTSFAMHPPINKSIVFPYDEMHKKKCNDDPGYSHAMEINVDRDYLERDRNIVEEAGFVIATPKNTTEEKRGSGTWYTIRQAGKMGKAVMIIWPDGTTQTDPIFEFILKNPVIKD